LNTSSAPVQHTMPRSSSLAIGQVRRSSVSNTSLSAARSPPNSRVENQRNSGRPTAVSRPRWRTTPASVASTCANTLSVSPLGAVPLPRPGAATTALRVGEAALERLPHGRLVRVLVFRLQQLPQLAGLLGRELPQPAEPARQLGAGRVARLGREQEPEHRPQPESEQERPEPRPSLAHSPASKSSGAATATGRGCAWDWSGGLTSRS